MNIKLDFEMIRSHFESTHLNKSKITNKQQSNYPMYLGVYVLFTSNEIIKSLAYIDQSGQCPFSLIFLN